MSLISEELAARELPPIPYFESAEETRKRLVEILSEHIYGKTPTFVSSVRAEEAFKHPTCFGGIAEYIRYRIFVTTLKGDFPFPLTLSLPKCVQKVPLMLHISFEKEHPSGFVPEEELVRKGIAIARFVYEDVAADDACDCFRSGVASLFPRNAQSVSEWGAIGMWAWAASRCLDFLLTTDKFDENRIAVVGHSRLGKTALWCGAQDPRFTHVFSNNSGCAGDAITRGKKGEQIEDISRVFPHWFCPKYRDYAFGDIRNMPFDQHFLLAAIAPRKVAIGVSSLDEWADPQSEYLNCFAASRAWERRGLQGFEGNTDRFSQAGDKLIGENISFFNRHGTHSMCREDWLTFADILLK